MQNILWVDIETTGLGEPVIEDEMLELGMVVTDKYGKVLDGIVEFIPNFERKLSHEMSMDPYVRNMHHRSGLADEYDKRMMELKNAPVPVTNREELVRIEEILSSFVGEYFSDEKTPLAGSSVHFDKRFIERYFPTFVKNHIHYRVLDMSTVSGICKLVNPKLYEKYEEEKKKRGESKHRPIQDLDDSIWTYQFMLDNFIHVYDGEE